MKFCLLGAVLLVTVAVASCGNVSYDGRSLIIDGQRKLLISASIHYPRSVPAVTLHPFSYFFHLGLHSSLTSDVFVADVAWSCSNSEGRWGRCD